MLLYRGDWFRDARHALPIAVRYLSPDSLLLLALNMLMEYEPAKENDHVNLFALTSDAYFPSDFYVLFNCRRAASSTQTHIEQYTREFQNKGRCRARGGRL